MPIRYTQQFTEGVLFEDGIGPMNLGVGIWNTPWVDMANYQRAVAVLRTGAMAATATLDMALQQATDALGTGAQAVPAKAAGNKAINQLAQAAGDQFDTIVIEVQSEELDVPNGFHFVRAQITIANAAVDVDAFILRFMANYEPVPITALTEVVD